MKKISRFVSCFILFCFILTSWVQADSLPVRLKDISKILEARDNQLFGFGLVVGLRNTGDSSSTVFTNMALTNMLKKLGITSSKEFAARNIAAVMVTATLPPYVKKGQRITVTVSSLGDSSSLVGGTLLMTPLQGADIKTYAVAQGPVVVGGVSEQSSQMQVYKNQPTVGMIPQGAIVEQEVQTTYGDQHNITLVLNDSNFITVSRATKAIQENGFAGAKAIDANTIKVPLADLDSSDLVNTIAKLENISLVPDSSSKVVINSRTGTIVIGEMVRLFPVALTHGNISIRINNNANQGGGGAGFGGLVGQTQAQGETEPPVRVDEQENKLVYLNPSSTLSSLVNALNEIGATPKDMVSIIQALHEAGALIASIEVL